MKASFLRLMHSFPRFATTLVAALAITAFALPAAHAQTVFSGKDPGANNLAQSPNSAAMSSVFNAAAPGTTLLNFEPGTATQTNNGGANFTVASGGATFTFTNQSTTFPPLDSTDQGAANGFNTTPGGNVRLNSSAANFGAPRSVTVTFASPVNSFGTFISGLGNSTGSLNLTYNDGAVRSFNLTNLVGDAQGGNGFFGVTGGGSFTSLTFTLAPQNGEFGDAFSFDDFRFRTASVADPVPEPSAVAFGAVFGMGTLGLIVRKRRRPASAASNSPAA